ncbi:hypothetical protein ACQP1P_44535 [Dactylosporangium sp. CA-052675]|uniref:hypothetical protein n=1 Tax=Dactylosporangium sp. CA-052675 TaxID=3239927 RepID=UPI003D94614B
MRFEISRVMDTIEQRLTTDVTLAQAVVDLAEVARFVALDGGRPINLLRLGMVVDALSRYLIDAGAMLYPVAGREVLSEAALTSKERMVLGRWADDGLIEVTPVVADRPAEIADFTGLPLIVVRDLPQQAARFPWISDSPERLLRLTPRAGGAVLTPGGEPTPPKDGKERLVVVGKATLPIVPPDPDDPATEKKMAEPAPATDPPPAEQQGGRPDGLQSFTARGSQRFGRTRVVRRRFTRADPSGVGASLMAREWRCKEPDCPAFGASRRIGQPVPRMRAGMPACPRHGDAVKDIGPRPPAFAVAVVVDDLARRRFVVATDHPVRVGKDPKNPDDISVATWLHEAAAAWIAKEHVRLEVESGHLKVTDTSENGTVIWKRSSPDIKEETERIYKKSYQLDGWDSIELYTGVELVVGDHRLQTVVGSEPASVLLDAPTVAMRLVD